MTSTFLSRKQLNFAQISIVCLDILKQCLIDILDIHIKPADLGKEISLSPSLTAGKDRLNSEQRDLCCPSSTCVPDYSKFDVTLLYRLIRHLCPTLKPSKEWGKEPKTTDLTIGDDIERIRLFRNKHYAHADSTEIPDSEFTDLWNEGKSLINRIQNFTRANGCTNDYGLKLTNISGRMIKYEEYTSYVDLFRAISIERNVEVTCGDTAHFKADVRLEGSDLSVSWEKIDGSARNDIDIRCEKYKGSSDRQLNIHSVSKEDEGEYQAIISRNRDHKIVSNIGFLQTQGELPRLDDLKVSTAKKEICIHYSHTVLENSPPVNDIKWTKNKTPLDLSNHKYCGGGLENSYLTISCPTNEDRGEYACTVSNAVGSVSQVVILKEPSAIISTNTTVVHGLATGFSCLISSCPSPEQIEWEKSCDGNTFYRIDINEPKYHGSNEDPISPVLCLPKTTFEDQQFYRIVVRNKIGECMSNTHFLKVTGNRPNITNTICTTKDRSVRLNCGVFLYEKSPALQDVYWTKNEQRLDIQGSGGKYSGVSTDDPSLTINKVNKHDAGNYQLTAINSVGPTKSDAIVLGVPDVVLKTNYKNEDGSQCFMVRIKSNPAPYIVQWSMKDKKSGTLQQINVNDDEYRGTSYSFPRPLLVVKHKETLENYSFRIEVQNVIGYTEKVMPDDTNPVLLKSDDSSVNAGNLNMIYERRGRNIRFGKVFEELAEEFPEAKFSRLKDLIQNSCEVEDVTSLMQAKSARDCFRILRSENIFTAKDVLCLQYLLKTTKCEELEKKCIEYAKMQNAMYYYEKPSENGYKNVYFHIIANIRDYSTEDFTKVKETVAAIAGCTVEEVHESGKLPAASFILVLSIKNNFVNKLLALNQEDEDKLKQLSIDYFKIGSTTIHLECSREKCGVKVLERGENEIMFAETKKFQAMCKNVRNQIPAVENDEGKVAVSFKARIKQQKDGMQVQVTQSTSSDKSKVHSPNGEQTPKETPREITIEEKEKIEQKVILAYKNLEAYLKSDQYDQELRNELEKSNPNYLDVLRKWRNDLENSDHGIVIAGETSAGKSTLINKMLGKMLFKGRNNESTSTICKLRNSERIRIVTTTMTGKTEETDFTDKCDLETKEGVRILRNFLKELTDMVSSTNSVTYRSVEIELPFSFLKCNTLLVDTPGIGGSGEVTKKLIDYLPNALIFIFVINVASAGGMQHDRLPEIMKSILLRQLDNSMPCFNPENVIFITTKWDTIANEEEDSSDEDEETKTWNTLRDNIKRRLPSVKEEFIFKMNLREVSPGKKNFSTEQFEEFKKVLETMVTNAENNRVMQHLRFLQEMLNNISKGLHARIELGKKTEEEQKLLVERQQKKIDMLTEECKQARKSFLEKNNKAKEDIAQECYKYMSTDAGKEKILNPPGRTPLSKVDWSKTDFEKEIEERVDAYVESYLQSDGVMERYKDIQIEVNLFHDKVNEILVEMESEWIQTRQVIHGFDPGNFLIAFGLLTSPLWFAALAIGFGVAAAVVAGVSFVLGALFGWNRKTDIEIYTEYNRYKATIRKKICKHLDENCGLIIVKLVDKVTDDVLPKRIQAFETMIRQISESRAKVLANQEVLKNLAMQINAMEETVTGLIKSLKT